MKKNLKELLETIAASSVRDFNGENSLNPKRIVLYTTTKFSEAEKIVIFNYLENCFLNTQWHIDNPIPIAKIPHYRRKKRGSKRGDYPIDVGACLKKQFVYPVEFLV